MNRNGAYRTKNGKNVADDMSLFPGAARLKALDGIIHPLGERRAPMVLAPGIREPQPDPSSGSAQGETRALPGVLQPASRFPILLNPGQQQVVCTAGASLQPQIPRIRRVGEVKVVGQPCRMKQQRPAN